MTTLSVFRDIYPDPNSERLPQVGANDGGNDLDANSTESNEAVETIDEMKTSIWFFEENHRKKVGSLP